MAHRPHGLRERSALRAGFTAFEIILVVGMVVVVGIVVGRNLGGYREARSLENTAEEVRALVQDAQRKSMTQEEESAWGVRFTNAASGDDSVIVFKGQSFVGGTVQRTYVLKRQVQFFDPGPGATRDVVFGALTGIPVASTSLSLVGPSGATQKLITISAAGTIGVSDVTVP